MSLFKSESTRIKNKRIIKAKKELNHCFKSIINDLDLYIQTLNTMAQLPFSASDCLYLSSHISGVSLLATAEEWKSRGYEINKKEKGFTLLDFDNGDRIYFDVSQTTVPNPERKRELRLPNEKLKSLLSNNFRLLTVTKEELTKGLPAYFDTKYNAVVLNRNTPFENLFPVLSKEIAHAYLFKKLGSEYNRADCETTANAVSYIICRKNNIDYPLPEFPSDYTPEMFKTHLDNVRLIADEIQDNIEYYYDNGKAQFERPKPLTRAEQVQEKSENKDLLGFELQPFKGCDNVYDLKRRYKELVKRFNYDYNNGKESTKADKMKSETIMRYINIEYEDLLSKFKN